MTSITRRPRMRLSKARLRVLRHQQAHKTRKARRELYCNHQQLPARARALFDPLAPAFSRPTYHRFVLLAVAAILTLGGHTICNLLRCLGAFVDRSQKLSHFRGQIEPPASLPRGATVGCFGELMLAG